MKNLSGVFEEQAKAQLSSIQTIPEFDTQLTMTSIVGGRGVGKSTVASLLSGNETMFVVRDASYMFDCRESQKEII